MKPLANQLRYVLWAILLWMAAAPAGAQPAAAEPNIRVGVLVDNYPFSFRNSSGRTEGFACDLLAAIEQEMGLRFERVDGTTREINAAFQAGRIDLLQSFARSPDRENMAEFSVAYLDMAGQIFVRKGGPAIQSLADLKGRKVLVHRGSLGERLLRQAGLDAAIVPVESVEQALVQVDRGEGDATLAARLTGLAVAHHLGLTHLRVLDVKVAGYDVDYCFAVQKGNHQLLARINEGMALLVRTGKFNALYQKWFGFVKPTGYTTEQILLATSVGLALALGITIWAILRQRKLRQRITEQSESLRTSAEQLRLAVQASDLGLWDWDLRTNRVVYSREWKKQLGHAENEIGDSFAEWEQRLHPEDEARVKAELKAYLAQPAGALTTELRLRHKDGTWRWIYSRGEVFRDDAGQAVRMIGGHLDITNRRQLEEQFRQAQKMEAIGQLAGGVAHDFNNILAAMMMQTDLASATEDLPAEARESLDELKVSAERAATLTRQLLAFSRRQVIQTRQLDLNEIVASLTKMLHRILGEDVRLELKLGPQPLWTRADAGMLDQVLLNLVVNARDAMPTGGQLRIETGAKTFTATEAAATELAAGRHIYLRVTDTGSGIAPEHRRHIFEPFFTTKAPGKGTGIGLATVFSIVKQHNGAITLESEVGRGTEFQIFLPASETTEASPAGTAAAARPGGGDETILLVEDDVAVRRLTRLVLERAGYEVFEAAHGVEALRLAEADLRRVDLLLTDMVMPEGLSGPELAARLQGRYPRLRTIFTSGYSPEIAGRELDLLAGQNFIPKPATPEQVLQTVRSSLDA